MSIPLVVPPCCNLSATPTRTAVPHHLRHVHLHCRSLPRHCCVLRQRQLLYCRALCLGCAPPVTRRSPLEEQRVLPSRPPTLTPSRLSPPCPLSLLCPPSTRPRPPRICAMSLSGETQSNQKTTSSAHTARVRTGPSSAILTTLWCWRQGRAHLYLSWRIRDIRGWCYGSSTAILVLHCLCC